ncbi:auxin-responsive protein SAUR64-like [Cynara cardunculus var. scolymus]|nr:auxin-responsive protein SAUR64-like [Cynara cardunculus var. scolymus]
MVSKIVKLVRKWHRDAWKSGSNKRNDLVANKGHFVVYAVDQSRFVMPLHYLDNNVFLELLRMSEDEFGLPGNGHITLPCDSIAMNHMVDVFEQGCSDDLERDLLVSIASNRCSSCS